MKIYESLLKPINETRYLHAENVHRYRCVIRYFFEQYEKINYWIYKEDVYEELCKDEVFSTYTFEECKSDFDRLVEWGNLVTRQDSAKVTSIEEFRNKKFRYQLSAYTVEIERMTKNLENMFVESASLSPTLLERIKTEIGNITKIKEQSPEQMKVWWDGFSTDFKRLNQNYQDYLHSLNSLKAEEMMKTKEFLIFKEQLTTYLNTFVRLLQVNEAQIQMSLKRVKESDLQQIFQSLLEQEKKVPRIDKLDEHAYLENLNGIWESVKRWFLSSESQRSESDRIMDVTNEIIQKITRYANNIVELHSMGANRKEEYKKVADIFGLCENIEEAHILSSYVFGIEKPYHIRGDFQRETDSINSGVYEEVSYEVEVAPRIRYYKERTHRSEIPDYTKLKEEKRSAMIKRQEEETRLVNSYIKDGCIDFTTLENIPSNVRSVFLRWISKATENKERTAKSDDGRVYTLHLNEEKKSCYITCEDGILKMPAYTIRFHEVDHE